MDEYEKYKLDKYHSRVKDILKTRLDALEDELLQVETNEPQNMNRAIIVAAKAAELAHTIYEIEKIYCQVEHIWSNNSRR